MSNEKNKMTNGITGTGSLCGSRWFVSVSTQTFTTSPCKRDNYVLFANGGAHFGPTAYHKKEPGDPIIV